MALILEATKSAAFNTKGSSFDSESAIAGVTDFRCSPSSNATAADISASRSGRAPPNLAGSVFLITSNGCILSLPIPSESPADPLNWSGRRRGFVLALLIMYAALTMFIVQTPANLILAFINDFNGEETAPFSIDALASSPTLLLGISFLFWIPMSVAFGRRPLLVFSALITFGVCVWAGYIHEYHHLLAAICLLGFASGTALSTVIDMTFIHERPLAIAFFWSVAGALPLFGLTVLPALVEVTKHWRIVYKGTSIPSIICLFLILFFVPETYFLRPPIAFDGRILVQSGTEKVDIYDESPQVCHQGAASIQTGSRPILPCVQDALSNTWLVIPSFRLWNRSICYPKAVVATLMQIFYCLLNPLVFWVTILNAINFAGMMSIGIGFPKVMAGAPYFMEPSSIFKVNLAAATSCLLALPVSYLMLNKVTRWLTLRNKGVRHAEFYLPAFAPPVLTAAMSLFIFAFAATHHWHPAAYYVAYALNSFSFVSSGVANTIWVTESLPQWAAAAIGVVGGVSYTTSWGITAALPAWEEAMGTMAVNVGIGSALLAVGLLVIPVAFWGRDVRQFIDTRWGAHAGGALRPQ